MITVYGIKNCDSVKKALSFFKKHDLAYELIDFKTTAATCQNVSHWLEQVEMKKLFNSRSTTYKNLNLKELNLDDDEKKEWLCKENLLIKRPVVEYNGKVSVGFNEKEYEEIFL